MRDWMRMKWIMILSCVDGGDALGWDGFGEKGFVWIEGARRWARRVNVKCRTQIEARVNPYHKDLTTYAPKYGPPVLGVNISSLSFPPRLLKHSQPPPYTPKANTTAKQHTSHPRHHRQIVVADNARKQLTLETFGRGITCRCLCRVVHRG
jgi:hypothetical protein